MWEFVFLVIADIGLDRVLPSLVQARYHMLVLLLDTWQQFAMRCVTSRLEFSAPSLRTLV